MKKPKNELVKLERSEDGITCATRGGETLQLPRAALAAMERYFEPAADIAWVVGGLFAPAGSAKKTKLRLVAKAPAALIEKGKW